MFITLYFIVTRLSNSLCSVRDHFLSIDPIILTVALLEQHCLAAETNVVAIGAARGTPLMPFFEGCSPSPLAPSYASAAAVDVLGAEDVGAASASAKRCSSKGKGGRGGGGGSGGGGGGSSGGGGGSGGGGRGGSGGGIGGSGGGGGGSGGSGGSGSGGTGGGRTRAQRGGSGGGQRQQQQRWSEAQSPQQLREWLFQRGASAELLRSGVAIFDLDFDAILTAMYALSVSAEGDCYRCVQPDPCIAAAALGASEFALLGNAPAEALHTFTLDSGASRCFFRDSTTLTPLFVLVPIRLPDPSGGPILARSSTLLPCMAVPSGSLSGLHLPSFSTNLVSTVALHDGMVTTTTPGGQRVSICTCTRTGCHLATFTRRPGSSLYTMATESPQVAASAQRSTPHSSSFPLNSAPLQTLHMDMWGPACISGEGRERYFLLVLDDYTRYTMVFPLRSKDEDLPILRLHFDRGGEFSSDLLQDFCREEGITQSLTLPASPQQNGIAKRRIGLVMEVARTSMIHAAAQPLASCGCLRSGTLRISSTSGPVSPWTGKVGDASVFRVAGNSCAAQGTTCGGAASGGAEPGGTESEGIGSGGAEPEGAEPGGTEPAGIKSGGAESEGAESGGAEPWGAALSGGPAGASPRLSPRLDPLSLQQLCEWLVRRTCLRSGATRAGATGGTGAGGARVTAGAGGTGGTAAAGPGGARTRGTGAAGTSGVGGAGAGDPTEPGVTGAGGTSAGGAGAGGAGARGTGAGGAGGGEARARGTGAGGAGAGGARAGGTGAGGVGAGGAGAGGAGAGGTVRPRPHFVPLLKQVLGVPSSTGLTPTLLCPPPDQSQPPLQPASLVPAPSPYSEQTGGLTERREPPSRPSSPVCTGRRVPRPRPPPVPGKHAMALRPSSVPLRVPLPAPPKSSLSAVPDPESNLVRAASPTVSRLLVIVVTHPSFESTAASALVAELLDLAAACRLDYATALVAESESASPPFVEGECALGTDALEDRQEDLECLAAAAAMDAEMASWKSKGTYVDALPSSRANIVDGMWIFSVKRPPGSPPTFKARYVARGFRQRQGVNYFQTFSPTPKMTTLWVLLHVAAQRDYELHSGLQITRERARHTITLTQSHMVHQVLQRFGFQFSSPEPTPLSTGHSLLAPPLNDSVEPSGPYPELVGCLMYLMASTRPDLAYPLSLLACYVAPGRHRKVHWDAVKRVLRYLCCTLGIGLMLGGRGLVVFFGHADASWVDDSTTQQSPQGYTFNLVESALWGVDLEEVLLLKEGKSIKKRVAVSAGRMSISQRGEEACHGFSAGGYKAMEAGRGGQPAESGDRGTTSWGTGRMMSAALPKIEPGEKGEMTIRVQCGLTESKDYDILLGMELLFKIGTTICTWQEQVLHHSDFWEEGKELSELPVRFVKTEPKKAWRAEGLRKDSRRSGSAGKSKASAHLDQYCVTLVELFGGIGAGLAAALEASLRVKKWVYVELEPEVRRMAWKHAQMLQQRYPAQLTKEVLREAMQNKKWDMGQITKEDVDSWGKVDLLVAGWECQGTSRAGKGKGLHDERTAMVTKLLTIMTWAREVN
ncbi:unnamed protein product [Closterium sp. NIES-54]